MRKLFTDSQYWSKTSKTPEVIDKIAVNPFIQSRCGYITNSPNMSRYASNVSVFILYAETH